MSEFRLPRIPRGLKIVSNDGTVSEQFRQWWQSLVVKLEQQEALQDAAIAAIQAAQAAADTAQAAAATAQTAANTAQAAANGANSVASLTNSGVTGLALTATDVGASVTISVSAHTRVYGDGTTLAIAGPSSILGLAYSTGYYVYYDDPTRADTTPSYQTTTTESTAAQTGDRHLVGYVMTPAAAAPPVDGETVRPPGLGNLEP